ncbi:hypothetical protein Q8F55_000217 [Vanrija albida]|uniref:Uncharacterized protein n=1 Tax=Vanrija albida TaxID=181172 RepID=A0ABR3QD80_9TREE
MSACNGDVGPDGAEGPRGRRGLPDAASTLGQPGQPGARGDAGQHGGAVTLEQIRALLQQELAPVKTSLESIGNSLNNLESEVTTLKQSLQTRNSNAARHAAGFDLVPMGTIQSPILRLSQLANLTQDDLRERIVDLGGTAPSGASVKLLKALLMVELGITPITITTTDL